MTFLSFTVALVLVSTINADLELYQPVRGMCDHLPSLYVGEAREIPAGLWNLPYATFGERCGSVYALMRGAPTYLGYGDVSVILKNDGQNYHQFTNDVQYAPDKHYYVALNGGKGYVLDCDENDYCFYIQCQEYENDNSQVVIMFGSRTREVSSKAKKAFQDMSDKLKAENLLPENLLHLNFQRCPKLPATFKPQM